MNQGREIRDCNDPVDMKPGFLLPREIGNPNRLDLSLGRSAPSLEAPCYLVH